MTRRMSRAWVLGTAAMWFVACGGTSTLHRGVPTGDDDSDGDDDSVVGSGGSGARAGSPGKAGNGGTGNGVGGGTVSAGGTGAKGGTTGKGGSSGKGGSPGKDGTSAVGGTAGSAGDDGLDVDPGCTCTKTGPRSVSCSTATVTVPPVFQDPNACAALDTRTKRVYCDDGSVHYTFIEGEENDYSLELDHAGNATYFSASGYVAPGCGLDSSDFDLATRTEGTPHDSSCFEECALCGEYENLPACEAYERDPNDPDTTLETLEQLCSRIDCPTNLDDMLTRADPCSDDHYSQVIFACNLIEVVVVAGFSEQTFIFDRVSRALIAVRVTDDLPSYPCHTYSYFAGSVPEGTCNGAQYCDFCTQGGEPGAGGAAGASGGIACVLLE